MTRLMVVDDEFVIAMQLKESLTAMGYEVTGVALSGEEAVEMAVDLEPELILIDIVMPGELDGIAAARRIKATIDAPVIFLTAHTEDRFINRAKQLEPYGYIVKPVQESQVRAAIEVALHKKEMERRLHESEQRYAMATHAGRVGVWDWDLETGEMHLEPNLKAMLGYENHEINNHIDEWIKIIHPDDVEKVMGEVSKHLNGLTPLFQFEHRMLHKDGSIRWFQSRGTATRSPGRKACRMTGADVDITDRKTAEIDLKKAHDELEMRVRERTVQLAMANERLRKEVEERKRAEERIRMLTQRLIRAQESERQRISLELHDSVAQDLATLKIAMKTLLSECPEVPAKGLKKLDDVSKTLDRALTSVREISYDLRPASLDLGLSRAIHQLVEEYSSRNGMKVDFVCAGVDELELDSDTKINLYRLIQESLNNVKKHARATRVTVRLVASFPKIILRVEDNGEGFDLQKERNGSPVNRHMGLWNMNERVGLLQGVMKIDTKPKQGTSILIEIPWKEQCLGQKANSLDR